MLSLTMRLGWDDRIVVKHKGEVLVIYLKHSKRNPGNQVVVSLDGPLSFDMRLHKQRAGVS